MNSIPRNQSLLDQPEELANTITHGIGSLLSVLGLVLLYLKAIGTPIKADNISYVVFGLSLIILYTTSTIYHAVSDHETKRLLRTFDHSAIFLLIAGTYTPFAMITLEGTGGTLVLRLIWALALAGVIFKIFSRGRYQFISLVFYLGMGWLAIFYMRPLADALAGPGLFYLIAGGFFYSFGVVFYVWEKLPYHHAIWHLFVLAGSVCHFLAIYWYIN